MFANSRLKAKNFKKKFSITRTFFLTVGQNNFGNKIPFFTFCTTVVMYLCTMYKWWVRAQLSWAVSSWRIMFSFAYLEDTLTELNEMHITNYKCALVLCQFHFCQRLLLIFLHSSYQMFHINFPLTSFDANFLVSFLENLCSISQRGQNIFEYCLPHFKYIQRNDRGMAAD